MRTVRTVEIDAPKSLSDKAQGAVSRLGWRFQTLWKLKRS
jgi:hypothetical protein